MTADRGAVPDLPKWAITRTAKLASLPLGVAGRTTLGIGKRIGGRPAELVAQEIQARTAEQLFRVLGELKGGAMKVGQAVSIFEAALPDELVGPYRATLTKLQDSAPALPAGVVHKQLTQHLGPDWRELLTSFEDEAAAAASIGQVHRGLWQDGREVAVKLQYPGAGKALMSDLNQLARVARMAYTFVPGIDIGPLIAEIKERVAEELDYELEAASQAAFAAAYRDDPEIMIPDVVHQAGDILVTEWMDGIPLSRVIAEGTQEQRSDAGMKLARFLVSAPGRVGLLHADLHPGNFRIVADGRLGVLDFGAVSRLPDGLPAPIGRLLAAGLRGDGEALLAGLREEKAVLAEEGIDPDELMQFVRPVLRPLQEKPFRFTRDWLRRQSYRYGDPRAVGYAIKMRFHTPPAYALIGRSGASLVGVLCQLEAEADWAEVMLPLMPGTDEYSPDAA